MFNLEKEPVECPVCEGLGKWQEDDEDGRTDQFGKPLWRTCGECDGEGTIPADKAPGYEAPSFEDALHTVFSAMQATLARRIAWHAASGRFAIAVRWSNAMRWSGDIAWQQRRLLRERGRNHDTTLWALWSISQLKIGESSRQWLVLDPNYPPLLT